MGKLLQFFHGAYSPEEPLVVVVDHVQSALLFNPQSGQYGRQVVGNGSGFIIAYCPAGPAHQFLYASQSKMSDSVRCSGTRVLNPDRPDFCEVLASGSCFPLVSFFKKGAFFAKIMNFLKVPLDEFVMCVFLEISLIACFDVYVSSI